MVHVRRGKLLQFINYRMRCTLTDGRTLIGTFMAFDQFMNIILSDTDEFRKSKVKNEDGTFKEVKRVLGFILLRGEHLVSMTVEAPPAPEDRNRPILPASAGLGMGMGKAAGRAVPIGLSAPSQQQYNQMSGRGLGAPAPHSMAPK